MTALVKIKVTKLGWFDITIPNFVYSTVAPVISNLVPGIKYVGGRYLIFSISKFVSLHREITIGIRLSVPSQYKTSIVSIACESSLTTDTEK